MHSRSPSKTNSPKIGHKKCKSCKKVLDLSNFYTGTNGNGRTYTDRTCRPCSNGEKNKRRGKTPESFIRHLYSQLKYKRKKTHNYLITPEEIIELYYKQNGKCALSGIEMTHIKDGSGYHGENISIDRIDCKDHYHLKNIQLVCYAVNMMKWTQEQEEMLQWCIRINNNYYDNKKQTTKTKKARIR